MIGQVPISGTLNPLLTNSQYNLYSLWNTIANSITVTGLTGMSTLKVTFTDNSKDRPNHCVGTVFFNIPHL